jgi:hypothetical protein
MGALTGRAAFPLMASALAIAGSEASPQSRRSLPLRDEEQLRSLTELLLDGFGTDAAASVHPQSQQ